jgi:hypothetical protein
MCVANQKVMIGWAEFSLSGCDTGSDNCTESGNVYQPPIGAAYL